VSRYFNLFYIVLLGLAILAGFLLSNTKQSALSFYGFAESSETEINYNYPVVVESILVRPGQEVAAGATLLKLARIKSKETLSDQDFRIGELESDAMIWQQKKNDELRLEEQELKRGLSEVDEKIKQLRNELSYKRSLVQGLTTIDSKVSDYSPLEGEIKELEQSRQHIQNESKLRIDAIKNEMAIGKNPFRLQINRLSAEKAFEADQMKKDIIVTAPSEGLIGNIFCKEAEHISSFKTLMTFYEPHSGIIKGYVHEDLTLQVAIGSTFKVSSLKDANHSYMGKVMGLGSRIVEIPARLRKNADFKTYGREVLIEIDKNNTFLQKEKVAISHVEG